MNPKKIPPITLLRAIKKAKNFLKTDPTMLNMFKEYGVDISEIDIIPTYFKNLSVSAKTDHGIVYLNYSLLEDGLSIKDLSYLIHEYCHWLQQCCGEKPTKSANDGDYLHNKFEQEGFANQVEYLANRLGDEEAEDYVDNLLEHHDKDGKEKKELKKIIMEKVK